MCVIRDYVYGGSTPLLHTRGECKVFCFLCATTGREVAGMLVDYLWILVVTAVQLLVNSL